MPDEVERMEEFIDSSISWWNELLDRGDFTEEDYDMIVSGFTSLDRTVGKLNNFLEEADDALSL